MGNLCADIILGQDFMEKKKSEVFTFNGNEATLQVCALTPTKVPSPSLFTHPSNDCKPFAVNQGDMLKMTKNLFRKKHKYSWMKE